MANLVQVDANNLLNASLRGTAYTLPTLPNNLALVTGNGSATGAGTEVVNAGGSTYARQPLSPSLGAASAGQITSTAQITFSNMPGTTTTAGVEIWDSAGTPVRRWFGALTTSKTTALGDTLSFASGSITATLS